MSTPKQPPPLPPERLKAAVSLWQKAGAQTQVRVSGPSMKPLLQPGDAVTFNPTASIRRGEVVVFWQDTQQGEMLVVHRVLALPNPTQSRPHYRTKGDAVPFCDPPLDPAQVLGRVVTVQRGSVARTVDTRLWRFLGWQIAALSNLRLRLFDVGTAPRSRWLRSLWRKSARLGLLTVEKIFWRWP